MENLETHDKIPRGQGRDLFGAHAFNKQGRNFVLEEAKRRARCRMGRPRRRVVSSRETPSNTHTRQGSLHSLDGFELVQTATPHRLNGAPSRQPCPWFLVCRTQS